MFQLTSIANISPFMVIHRVDLTMHGAIIRSDSILISQFQEFIPTPRQIQPVDMDKGSWVRNAIGKYCHLCQLPSKMPIGVKIQIL